MTAGCSGPVARCCIQWTQQVVTGTVRLRGAIEEPIGEQGATMTAPAGKTALIIGASRGLGYALAAEYLARGWQVTATVRGSRRTELHSLASSSAGRLVVETVDITVPEETTALYDRLSQTRFDLLFINAGGTNGPEETIAD